MTTQPEDLIASTQVTQCRSCDKPIRWVRTEGLDKPMPVDAKPQSVFISTVSTRDGAPVARVRKGWTSHFVTCPDRKQWRKH